MNNQDVAYLLDDIGDMLEILGDNPFRIRAHHRAANSIRSSPVSIETLVEEKRLTSLPAVGEGLAERIEELVTTGKMLYYQELQEQVPPRLLELMQIQGVGPRKAKQLYEELSVTSVDELKKAAAEGRLRELKGMSAQTEENILKGIELFRAGQARMLLSEAYPIAAMFVAELEKASEVNKIALAGSLRRMKETIGDIDILVASDNTAAVTKRFCGLPEVDRVLAHGDTKASILAKNGLQIDLRVVKTAEYGSALQYFTGSKDHNIRLRDLAKQKGLKISEYGIFSISSNRNLGGKTEEEIYAHLGLDYIDPVLREDHGEIAAAKSHTLPNLVSLSDVRGDLQSHSTWSDGLNLVKDMALAAGELGYEYLAVTDHAEKLKVAGGMTREAIAKRRREIEKLNGELKGIRLLDGVELNIDGDGNVDYDDDVLEGFDVVLGSIHSGFQQPRQKIMARLAKAMENKSIHIIAHPTGRIIGKREPYDVDIEGLFDLAARTGTVLEINSFPDRLDLKDDYAREAKRRGLKMSLGTDAHMAAHLPYMMYGVAVARRAWLEPQDIINTLPLEKMLAALKNKQ